MKETWGFVWFAAALCVIMIVSMLLPEFCTSPLLRLEAP